MTVKNPRGLTRHQNERYREAAEIKNAGKSDKWKNEFERRRVKTAGPQFASKKKPAGYGRKWVDKVPAPKTVDGDEESDDLTYTQKYRGKVLDITTDDYPVLHCTDLKSMSPEKQAEMQRLYGPGSDSERKRKVKIARRASGVDDSVTLLEDWDND